MAAASGTAGWAQLRQQARTLETQTEAALQTYSQFSNVPNIPPKPTQEERDTETKLQDLLEKRDKVVGQLARLLDSEAPLTSSATKQSNLSLIREKLSAHRRDLSRLRSSLSEARARANLLSAVRDDIESYRTGGGGGGEAAEADYMLDERARIDGTHNVADGVLAQAYAVRENFASQGEVLASINRRIVGAASQVPGINTLITRISAKKRRDGIVMGGFIAVCFLMFWFFL